MVRSRRVFSLYWAFLPFVCLPLTAGAQGVDSFNPIANSGIITVALQHDGKILIGGSFTALGPSGSIPRAYIARINTDGTVDSSFNPGADGYVRAIAVQGNGQILVGGEFNNLAGSPRQRIGRLNSDGTLDAAFNPGLLIGLQTAVSAIAVQTDTKILVGGIFNGIGGGTGTTPRTNLARLNADGTVDANYTAAPNLGVRSIALQTNGAAIISGFFTSIGDANGTHGRNLIARLDTTSLVDLNFDPNVGGSTVDAVAIQADGRMLIGGTFGTVGGQSRFNIARVNNDLTGTVDATFNPGASSSVASFAIQADGKIWVCGGFSTIGGGSVGSTSRRSLARLNADGTVDPIDPGTNNLISGLVLQQDGKLVVVGTFNHIGGGGTGTIVRSGIARLFNTPATQSLTLTGGSTITWMRDGGAPEIFRAAFHTTTDGVTYTFRGYGARIAGGWELTGLSIPSDPNLRVRARGFYQTGDRNGSTSVYETGVPPSNTNVVENNSFSSGTTGWSTFATPNATYMVSQVVGGVFQFYRAAPPPGTSNQALIFQPSGLPIPPGAPVVATFELGNTDTVRKRISVLMHDNDFSDLSVCTFYLPPSQPLTTYGMKTHTTKPWSNATISFYAASANAAGNTTGFYLLDNVSVQYAPAEHVDRTECIDAMAPAAPGGADGPELLANGNFATGTLAPWSTFGQIQGQVTSNVFEFIKLAGTPAGVILQATGQPVAGNTLLTATFDLGNTSAVRKRVTVLIHDNTFGDLSACTFWVSAGQPLSTYTYRTYATQAWSNATISVYPATAGPEQWIQLDNVSLKATPSASITGAQCLEPVGYADRAAPQVTTGAATSMRRPSVAAAQTNADAATSAMPIVRSASGRDWIVDLTHATSPRLSFLSWLAATSSQGEVQVSANGVDWDTIAVVAASETWTPVEVDLSAFRGDVILLRFVLMPVVPADPAEEDTWRIESVTASP